MPTIQGKQNNLDTINPVNHMNPLNSGLISWWMNMPYRWGGGGSVFRDLLQLNHGDLVNMDPSNWRGDTGRQGGYGALNFDGSTERVTADGTVPVTTPLTLIGWANGSSLSGNDTIMAINDASDNDNWFRIMTVDGFSALDINALSGGGFERITGTIPISTNEWFQVAGVFSSTTSRELFINGRPDGSSTTSINPTQNMDRASIGVLGRPLITEFFDGFLDDLRIYDRALSGSEISAIYQESRRGYPNTLNWMRRPTFVPAVAGAPTPYYYQHLLAG